MKPIATVTARHILMLAEFGARRGLDVDQYLSSLGLRRDELTPADARVPSALLGRAWREIPALVSAPYFGLELSETAVERPPHNGLAVLFYAARNSATLRSAYETIARYLRIIHDTPGIHFDVSDGEARWFGNPKIPPQASEFLMATILGLGRRMAGSRCRPEAVRFEHAALADAAPHHRVFGVRVEFDQPATEIVFARAVIDLPVVGADPALYAMVAERADELLARVPQSERPIDRVRECIVRMVGTSRIEIEDVARSSGTSTRSLQRMLHAAGLSFRQVVDDVRRELALRHMHAGRLSVSELAFVLGFADATSFHRAFRRWTGSAPGEYAREHLGPDRRLTSTGRPRSLPSPSTP
jgi:AraC-like DNA-binding protein